MYYKVLNMFYTYIYIMNNTNQKSYLGACWKGGPSVLLCSAVSGTQAQRKKGTSLPNFEPMAIRNIVGFYPVAMFITNPSLAVGNECYPTSINHKKSFSQPVYHSLAPKF